MVTHMKVLGIVGSPRKNGLTSKLVIKALKGAESAGAETDLIYLSDYPMIHCTECTDTCWTTFQCLLDDTPTMMNTKLQDVDSLILGAPVYYLDINGLTKNFIDTTRVDMNGKSALGIAIAGGTGKGLTSALKSLYYFFFCIGLRGVYPLPVSRFNYKDALNEAYTSGKKLTEEVKKPFKDLTERVRYHYSLRYMNYDITDENMMLATQLLTYSKENKENRRFLEKAMIAHRKAEELMKGRCKDEAVEYIMQAYNAGFQAWKKSKNCYES